MSIQKILGLTILLWIANLYAQHNCIRHKIDNAFNYADSGLIISTDDPSVGFFDFLPSSGSYITKLEGYVPWPDWLAIDAYASDGSSECIMIVSNPQINVSDLIVPSGEHIISIGPSGSDSLSVWTETGLLGNLIEHSGTGTTWLFTLFAPPGGEVISGFTSQASGGWFYLKAYSTELSGVLEEMIMEEKVKFQAAPTLFIYYTKIPGHEQDKFLLYDISGKLIGTYQGDRIGEGLPAGVYFVKPSNKKTKPVRVIKVR